MPTSPAPADPGLVPEAPPAAPRSGLGPLRRDPLRVFEEAASVATDTALPFWLVLLLSGAIATLGLVLNSTAVVIGAMLVAPLLGPILGLSLALAVGDGRLALQTAVTVALGAAGVVALAAVTTWALPFDEITPEIASRTRPTTLDLGVAIASGLAGAVVTASQRSTLAGSLPGVAVAVALIPPLSVTGFGIGTGRPDVAGGSLLLFGANLAGIVLSGLVVFLAAGLHQASVAHAARAWHEGHDATGLAAWLKRVPLARRLRVFGSPWARAALVLAFVALVAWPLTATLGEVIREGRVQSAAAAAEASARAADVYVLDRQVSYGADRAAVRLRVAAEHGLPDGLERRLTAAASRQAGEPVTVRVERVLAVPGAPPAPRGAAPARAALATPTVETALASALGTLALPDSVEAVALAAHVGGAPALRVGYTAPRRLPPEAEAMLARQAAAAAGVDAAGAAALRVPLGAAPLPADTAAAAGALRALAVFPATFAALRLVVVAPDSAAAARARRVLRRTPGTRVDVGAPARTRLALAGDAP